MRKLLFFIRYLFLFLSAYIFSIGNVSAKEEISLAAIDRTPYLELDMPSHGYVGELVHHIFENSDYDIKLSFYPIARAKQFAKHGLVDGIVPAYFNRALQTDFNYSNPFPGNSIGFLKHKSLKIPLKNISKNIERSLKQLKPYRFGLVREETYYRTFDQANYLDKQIVETDLQNIDKLDKHRVDIILIDKFSAANILVNLRPHLIGELDFIPLPHISRKFHIAFSRKNIHHRKYKKYFNDGLRIAMSDGTVNKLLSKYGFQPKSAGLPTKKKIVIGMVNNHDMLILKKLSVQYEKQHPNIQLEWKILTENILRQRLLSDLAISDGQFDVMSIGAYEAPIWARNHWLHPLSNLGKAYDLADIIQPIKASLTHDEKLYALPFYAESSVTFYRKDLFKKANIRMPSKPTYSEIITFAEKIHNPKEKIYGICLRGEPGWGGNIIFISTMVNAYGGQWFDQHWKSQINTPKWKEAISKYKELILNYGPPNVTKNGFLENQKLFLNGHCGIWIDATVAAGMLFNKQHSLVYDKVGIVYAPREISSKGSSWIWTWSLAIPESSKNKKIAQEFISWATSKEYIKEVAASEGWLSVPPGTRKSTYSNINYQTAAPFSEFVIKAIQNIDLSDSSHRQEKHLGIQLIDIPEFPALGGYLGIKIAKVLEGEISIDEALKDAEKFANELMKKSGYYK